MFKAKILYVPVGTLTGLQYQKVPVFYPWHMVKL